MEKIEHEHAREGKQMQQSAEMVRARRALEMEVFTSRSEIDLRSLAALADVIGRREAALVTIVQKSSKSGVSLMPNLLSISSDENFALLSSLERFATSDEVVAEQGARAGEVRVISEWIQGVWGAVVPARPGSARRH